MDSNLAGEPTELELSNYLSVLWRHKLLIVITMLICALVAYKVSSGDKGAYRANTEVLLQLSVSEDALQPDTAGASADSRSRVSTAMQVLQSRSVKDAAAEELGHKPKITIAQVEETDLITIAAEAKTPKQAQTDAQTYTEVSIELARDRTVNDVLAAAADVQEALDGVRADIATIEAPLTELDNAVLAATTTEDRQAAQVRADAARTSAAASLNALRSREAAYSQQADSLNLYIKVTTTGGLQVVSDADIGSRTGPQPRRNAVVGLIIGLLLGIVLAFGWHHFDDRLRNRRDLQLAAPSLGVLAAIPALRPGPPSRRASVASLTSPSSPAADAYRALRTTVQVILEKSSGKVMLVTSPSGRDGRGAAETAANLAVALARAGSRVVVIDCDLHRPQMHTLFGLSNDRGVTSVLNGADAVATTLQHPIPSSPLAVVTAGPTHPNPSDALASDRMRDVLHVLASESDYLVVHSAPVLSVTDSLVLSGTADGVLLVAAGRRTRGRSLTRALESLEQVKAHVMGTVLTSAPYTRHRYGSRSKGGLHRAVPVASSTGTTTGTTTGTPLR